MTDKEQDELLINTLKIIISELKESVEYFKQYRDEEFDEAAEVNQEEAEYLEEILDNISSIDDLAQLDEEAIDAVYEDLADYTGNFIIAAENQKEQFKKDTETHNNLIELLDLFLDTDDGEEEI